MGIIAHKYIQYKHYIEEKKIIKTIQVYLDLMPVDSVTCVREIQEMILGTPYQKSTMFSRIVANVINSDERFVKIGRPYLVEYGRQRCWKKYKDKI